MPIRAISSWVLPDDGPQRNVPPRTVVSDDSFWAQYDQTTLFYDCFFDALERKVRLFAPKFFNLESDLRDWYPHIDGQSVSTWRIRHFQKFDVLECTWPDEPRILSFHWAGQVHQLTIQASEFSAFASRKVLCTVSKNNELRWIADWMSFHHEHHGADALLLFDNGSDRYTPAELDLCVRSVPGFRTVRVVPVPLPYGPQRGATKGLGRSCFLQVGLLNLARARFLKQATGVLCIDIDELVQSRSGIGVFDATQASWFGYLAFEGHWRYAKTSADLPLHADHQWYSVSDRPCPSKYCYCPSGWLGRQTLDVHGLSLISRHLFPVNVGFSFMHCRSISTSWKERRDTPPVLERDRTCSGQETAGP